MEDSWCKYHFIFAVLCHPQEICNDNGICNDDGKCECDVDHFGEKCKSECNFSVCILIKQKNWYKTVLIFAAFCNAEITCSDNGLCDSDGKCKCNEHHFGPDCKSKLCFIVV